MAPSLSRSAVLVLLIAAMVLGPAASQQVQLAREPDSSTGAVPADDEATQGRAVARRPSAFQILTPYEQCGGESGLCNTTTIGVPCGDAPWGLECPDGYTCQRKTAAMWQCYPLLGKNDPADQGPTRFATAPKGSEADQPPPRVVPVSNGTVPKWNSGRKADSSNSTDVTPEVTSCPAGTIAVGSRCFRNSAGSRKGMAGTLAGNVALLTAWQLAIVLATALLAC